MSKDSVHIGDLIENEVIGRNNESHHEAIKREAIEVGSLLDPNGEPRRIPVLRVKGSSLGLKKSLDIV